MKTSKKRYEKISMKYEIGKTYKNILNNIFILSSYLFFYFYLYIYLLFPTTFF